MENRSAEAGPRQLPVYDPRPLIAEVDAALADLLRDLEPEDWERPAVKSWRVRHVVAHLLDTSLRRLSLDRDRWSVPTAPPIESYADLVRWLDELNAEWTGAADRLSPAVLTALTAWANDAVGAYFDSLELAAPATFPVSWAGENESAVWMDLARELTEKWLHQQQIRDAVERPGLAESRFLAPILDTFARALPRAYGGTEAEPGTAVEVAIDDLEECRWRVTRESAGWAVYRGGGEGDATIRLAADTAWRLFVKGLTGDEARRRATTHGSTELVDPFFATLAIMG